MDPREPPEHVVPARGDDLKPLHQKYPGGLVLDAKFA
jgi:hypothetical protein